MYDLMIDLETLGLPPNGALVSIGACFFDLATEQIGPTFERTIHLATGVRDGGVIDPSTVIFWLGQPDKARDAIRFGGQDIGLVLLDFSDWIAEHCRHEDVRPWFNSPAFDGTIIGTAYDRIHLKRPWHFSRERDFRTVRAMYPSVEYDPSQKGDDAHTALADAKFQVQHLLKIKHRNRK
jgi:exodeoxyribonuclease VIII